MPSLKAIVPAEAAPRRGKGRRARLSRHAQPATAAMVAGLLLTCGTATGQNVPPTPTPVQSPEEINKRLQELEQQVRDLRATLQAVQQAKPQPTPPGQAAPQKPPEQPPADEVKERLDEQEKKVAELTDRLEELKPGTEKFLLSGFVWAGFTQPQHGDSTFSAAFKPVFLWKVADNLVAAASAEFEIDNNDTKVNIEYANLNWLATDWLILRGGVMLSPMSTFQQSLHPQWINKLPDNPLFAGDSGLAPEKSTGFEARGGFRTDIGKFTYSAFVTNGPTLFTTGDQAGQLNLDEFTDLNGNKAVGGRLGYLPIPELELAYALQYNDVAPSGSGLDTVNMYLHDFSISYVADEDWLGGRIDARTEFMYAEFSHKIDLGFGPFSNNRVGGYAQVAYRPTRMSGFLKDVEGVLRWDFLNMPQGAPIPTHEQRWTVGLNYWLNPRTVFKLAYEFDHVNDPSGQAQRNNVFMFQTAIGF